LADCGLSATGIKLEKDLIARLRQDNNDNDKADASSATTNPQSSITVKAEADIDVPSAISKTPSSTCTAHRAVRPFSNPNPLLLSRLLLFDELNADALTTASQQSPSAFSLRPDTLFAERSVQASNLFNELDANYLFSELDADALSSASQQPLR
ncbi:hypothetical protein KCU78_g4596, partial [Aureobasidium melanogenum]